MVAPPCIDLAVQGVGECREWAWHGEWYVRYGRHSHCSHRSFSHSLYIALLPVSVRRILNSCMDNAVEVVGSVFLIHWNFWFARTTSLSAQNGQQTICGE